MPISCPLFSGKPSHVGHGRTRMEESPRNKLAGPSDSNEQAPPGRAGERASIFSVRFFCCREEGKQARRLTPTLTHGVTDRPIIPQRKGNKRSLVMPSPPSRSVRPSVRPPVPPNHSPATHSPSTVRRGAGRHGVAAEEDRRRWTRGRRTLMQHYKVCKNGRLRCAACIPLPARGRPHNDPPLFSA